MRNSWRVIEGSPGPGVIVSHPTGNTFVRALLNGLNRLGKLQRFYTGFGYSRESLLGGIPNFMACELKRREYPLSSSQIVTHSGRDLVRLLAGRLGIRSLTRHEKGWASVDAVYREVDESLASSLEEEKPSIVYAYEDGALSTFRKARQLGMPTCYELPIAYWETVRKIHEEEAERLPEWKVTFPALRDSEEKYNRKREEIRLADAIICPSRFVLDSLPDEIRNSRRCTVAEFGSPTDVPFIRRALPKPDQPVRFLFVGSMSQRKGLADLFAAFSALRRRDIQLIVAGTPHCDLSFYRGFFSDFVYEPPRSHAEILRLMQTCHVFVLPSLVEGRALVQQEAMVCGLPLLTTRNAGGEDLVVEGETGYLVPIRSPDRLADRINWFADNRDEIVEMGARAREHALKCSWKRYIATIIEKLEELTLAGCG